ncbi:hypothetical protein LJR234_006632 [Mesorhizobium amorphae]|uniref:hypothetical protein n=1 Tax=Mesorhizobium amorphae TaxID=71433 RepID=UPI003ECD6E70
MLLLSKFVIVEANTFVFGERGRFEGMLHGVEPLNIVDMTLVIAEEVIVRFVSWNR